MQIRIIGNRVKIPNRPAAVIGELTSEMPLGNREGEECGDP